jgi:2-C-methyl-D-erythritol 4-phosphate cytidylyltransferase
MNHAAPDSTAIARSCPRYWGLIPCAGSGSRAGSDGPKQYQVLAGQPMVMHTLAAFSGVERITNTVVVVAAGDHFFESRRIAFWVAACGGMTRASSVFNGLDFLLQQGADPHDWVLVHDAARCLITSAQINALIDACDTDAVGGILAHKLADSLKGAVDGRVAQSLSRSDKWLAQTPQMFRIGMLRSAMEQAGNQVTDESSAIEYVGLQPLLVPGSAQNFKVTYADDFALAQAVLSDRARDGDSPCPVPVQV